MVSLCPVGTTECPAPVHPSSEAVTVEQGATVRVVGTAFGTACNDTRTPGDTRPVLGDPATDIVLRFGDAGGPSRRLATVDADARYRFDVTVRVPSDAATGAARITVDPPPGRGLPPESGLPLRVVPPIAPTTEAPTTSATGAATRPSSAEPGEGDESGLPTAAVLAVVAGGLLLLAGGGVLLGRAAQRFGSRRPR